MKKMLLSLAASLAIPVMASASCCNPCDACCVDTCDPCGFTVYGGVDALYLKPMHCPIQYAAGVVNAPTPDDATRVTAFTIKGADDWGVNAHLGVAKDRLYLEGDYTYFSSTQKLAQSNGGFDAFFIGQSPPWFILLDRAEARLKNEYNQFAVRLGGDLINCCDTYFGVYLSAHWVDLKQSFDVLGITPAASNVPNNFVRQKTTFDGAGLGAGFAAHIPLMCNFGIHARSGIKAIMGDTKLERLQVNAAGLNQTNNLFDVRTAPSGAVVPAIDFKVGFDYTYKCDCWAIRGEIGYQADYYWGAIIRSDDLASDFNFPIPAQACADLGFGGLYFGVAFVY